MLALLACVNVPKMDLGRRVYCGFRIPVKVPSRQGPAVGRERHPGKIARVLTQGIDFFLFVGLPEKNRGRPRGKPLSIGNGQDRTVWRENCFWFPTREAAYVADGLAC